MHSKERIVEEIFAIRAGVIERIAAIRRKLFRVKDLLQLKLMPAWAVSKIKDETGDIEWEYAGYGERVLVIKLEDPWTDDVNKKGRKTAFVVYFSLQTSKPLVPAQLPFKFNTLYKVVNRLRAKGYHVFPALVAYNATPGARELMKKHKVEFFNSLADLLNYISSKLILRLRKLVEVAKFTLQFDAVFSFLKQVVEGLGFEVPLDIIEAWVLKPKYPNQA